MKTFKSIEIGSISLSAGGINYRGALIQAARYNLHVRFDGRLSEVQALTADGFVTARIDAPKRMTIKRTKEIVAEFNTIFGK